MVFKEGKTKDEVIQDLKMLTQPMAESIEIVYKNQKLLNEYIENAEEKGGFIIYDILNENKELKDIDVRINKTLSKLID